MTARLSDLARLALEEQRKDRDKLRIVSMMMDLCPVPQWIKRMEHSPDGVNFRMLKINAAYERRWDVRREDYEGALDADIWGPEVGAEFAKHDMEAVRRMPAPFLVTERVPDMLTGGQVDAPVWRIAKVAADSNGEILVAGIAFRVDEFAEMMEQVGV